MKKGKSVAILAIDPTSPFSGGAVLGDRLRMSDAQTSGGLLVALPEKEANEYAKRCTQETGLKAQKIGLLSTKEDNRIIIK